MAIFYNDMSTYSNLKTDITGKMVMKQNFVSQFMNKFIQTIGYNFRGFENFLIFISVPVPQIEQGIK